MQEQKVQGTTTVSKAEREYPRKEQTWKRPLLPTKAKIQTSLERVSLWPAGWGESSLRCLRSELACSQWARKRMEPPTVVPSKLSLGYAPLCLPHTAGKGTTHCGVHEVHQRVGATAFPTHLAAMLCCRSKKQSTPEPFLLLCLRAFFLHPLLTKPSIMPGAKGEIFTGFSSNITKHGEERQIFKWVEVN